MCHPATELFRIVEQFEKSDWCSLQLLTRERLIGVLGSNPGVAAGAAAWESLVTQVAAVDVGSIKVDPRPAFPGMWEMALVATRDLEQSRERFLAEAGKQHLSGHRARCSPQPQLRMLSCPMAASHAKPTMVVTMEPIYRPAWASARSANVPTCFLSIGLNHSGPASQNHGTNCIAGVERLRSVAVVRRRHLTAL